MKTDNFYRKTNVLRTLLRMARFWGVSLMFFGIWTLFCAFTFSLMPSLAGSTPQISVGGVPGSSAVAFLWVVSCGLFAVSLFFQAANARAQIRANMLERINLIPIPVVVTEVDDAFEFLVAHCPEFEAKGMSLFKEHPEYGRVFLGLLETKFVNLAALRVFGASSMQELRKRQHEMADDETLNKMLTDVMMCRITGSDPVVEVELKTFKGDVRNFLVRWIRVPATHWASKMNMIVYIDQTERIMTYRALLQREALLEGIFRASPVGHAFVRNRTLEWVNQRFEEILGYAQGELTGSTTQILFPDEEQYRAFARYGYPADKGEEAMVHEMTLRHKDGSERECRISLAYLKKGDPDSGVVIICQDISAMRRNEKELRSTRQELVQARKLEIQSLLLRGAAHDLSNILTAILLHIDVMRTSSEDAGALKESFNDLSFETKQGISMVRQLVSAGNSEAMVWDPVDVLDSIRLATRTFARCFGPALRFVFEESRSDLRINGDRGMLEQVWMNLFLNVRELHPGGATLRLSTRAVAGENLSGPLARPDTDYILISFQVTELGTGYPLRDSADGRRTEGLKLGKAAIDAIVAHHQGWIEAHDGQGRAGALSLYFPLAAREDEAAEPLPDAGLLGKSRRVLLIEENTHVRNNLALLLRHWGFEVTESSPGNEDDPKGGFDLVIADLLKSGPDATADRLAGLQKAQASAAFVVLVGEGGQSPRPAGPRLCCLEKPFDAPRLQTVIRALLSDSIIP